MSGFYAVIYFRAACYANFGICCYNFVMSVYGILVWRGVHLGEVVPSSCSSPVSGGQPKDLSSSSPGTGEVAEGRRGTSRPITSCPTRLWPWLIAATLLLTLLFRWLLGLLGESTLPVVDGLSSALNIVGMWMLTQKYWQQWFTWLLVEPLMIGLCLASGLYASAAMYAVYEVFVIMGMLRWKKESIS